MPEPGDILFEKTGRKLQYIVVGVTEDTVYVLGNDPCPKRIAEVSMKNWDERNPENWLHVTGRYIQNHVSPEERLRPGF